LPKKLFCISWLLCLILLVVLFPVPVLSAEFYVSSITGNDLNDGSSWALAKATIGAALEEAALTPEVDTIRVGQGVYDEDCMAVGPDVKLFGGYNEGTELRDRTVYISKIVVNPNDGDPCFSLGSNTVLDGFLLEGRDLCPGDWVVSGCYKYTGYGIWVWVRATNVIVQNNRIFKMTGATFEDCLGSPHWNCSGGSVIGIYVGSSASAIQIINNEIERMDGGNGYQLGVAGQQAPNGGDAVAILADSGLTDGVIAGNRIIEIAGGKGGDHECANCELPGDAGDAIGIFVRDGQNVLVTDNSVTNVKAGDGGEGLELSTGDITHGRSGLCTGISISGSGEVSDNTIASGQSGFPSASAFGIDSTGEVNIENNDVGMISAGNGYEAYGGEAAGIRSVGINAVPLSAKHNVVHSITGGDPGGKASGVTAQVSSVIFNNLVFDIRAGAASSYGPHGVARGVSVESPDVSAVNNTVARVKTDTASPEYSTASGILFAAGADGCTLENNIVAETTGVGVGSDGGGFGIQAESQEPAHSHNISFGSSGADYEGNLTPDPTDLSVDPLFAAAGAGPLAFFLSQSACGQGADSPAVDSGSDTASALGLDDRTTCTASNPDAGVVDRGYHYRQNKGLGSPPELVATKTMIDADGGELNAGDPVSFEITIENRGGLPAPDVRVMDFVDPGLWNLTASTGRINDGNGIFWSGDLDGRLASIDPGGSVVLPFMGTLSCRTADGTPICNGDQDWLVTMDGPGDITRISPPCLTVAIPDLSASTKQIDPSSLPAMAFSTIHYTVRVCNQGSGIGSNVVVKDTVDASLDETTILAPGAVVTANMMTWTLSSLGPGSVGAPTCQDLECWVIVRGSTPAGTTICNTATIASDEWAFCGRVFSTAPACFTTASPGELLREWCTTLSPPCDLSVIFDPDLDPYPLNIGSGPGSVDDPESGILVNLSKPLVFYEVTSPANPNAVRCTKNVAAQTVTIVY
jgi:uncharacterized repeat protein (TIGR01451 family)